MLGSLELPLVCKRQSTRAIHSRSYLSRNSQTLQVIKPAKTSVFPRRTNELHRSRIIAHLIPLWHLLAIGICFPSRVVDYNEKTMSNDSSALGCRLSQARGVTKNQTGRDGTANELVSSSPGAPICTPLPRKIP